MARREDVARVAAELARLREGVGMLLEHLERERLVAAFNEQSAELAQLRAELLQSRAGGAERDLRDRENQFEDMGRSRLLELIRRASKAP